MKKKVSKIIGLISLTLGLTLNFQYALGDYNIKDAPSLSKFVMAQNGTNSGTCTARGGNEMPEQILRNVSCIKSINIAGGASGGVSIDPSKILSLSGEFNTEIVYGSRCSCENTPSGYQGTKGCNLTWESACN